MVKNTPANIGEMEFRPWVRRSPGEGKGHPLQYPCLGNPMDRGAWWATVHLVTKSQTHVNMHARENAKRSPSGCNEGTFSGNLKHHKEIKISNKGEYIGKFKSQCCCNFGL